MSEDFGQEQQPVDTEQVNGNLSASFQKERQGGSVRKFARNTILAASIAAGGTLATAIVSPNYESGQTNPQTPITEVSNSPMPASPMETIVLPNAEQTNQPNVTQSQEGAVGDGTHATGAIIDLKSPRELVSSPDSSPEQTTKSNIVISPEDSKLLYKRNVERIPLSELDIKVKNQIVDELRKALNIPSGDIEGAIFQNENVRVEYVSGPDDFEAEILVPNFNLAKQQVEDYLKQKGLSKEGICNLPLNYYVGGVSNELPQNTSFDPNPLACKK